MKVQSKSTPKVSREARHLKEISPHTATAQWWQDRASMFKGLDKSLYLEEITEELEGIEQRKYLSIQGSTDLSRAEFGNLATEAGLVLNLPLDVEPFQHFCDEFRKDQQENNPDYRPGEEEGVLTWIVKNGEEIKKEHRAELVEWNKAIREAEGVTDKDTSIDSPTVFGKAVEIASKRGVSSKFFLDLKQEKHVERSTKTICTVPNAGQAAAAFCSRLATEARKLERHKTKRGKIPNEKIIDRDREIARLAFEDKPIEVIAIHLDDLEFFTPKTWKKPKYAPKGEKYTTGIRVLKLRQSFLQMVSRAKKKYPAPAPSCLA